MGKRPAAAKATRGVSKAKNRVQSSSSNPKTRKFRSQYNNLAVIAKGGISKKPQNGESAKKLSKGAAQRQKILKNLEKIDMIEHANEQDGGEEKKKTEDQLAIPMDVQSTGSAGSKFTTASFASVWSNCTNTSLNEFFLVWDPKLEAHKDALAVIAGLSQTMSNIGTEQTDTEFAHALFKIISSDETPQQVLIGSLLALTFVMRKLSKDILNENFDQFYPILKKLIESYANCKKKTLVKCILRCFACLTKAHPLGKEAIESSLRKKINIAIRQYKVQSKISI